MSREGAKIPNDGQKMAKNGQQASKERKPSPKDGQKESKENEASRKEEPIISREAANTSRAVRLGLFMVGSLIILAIGVFLIGNREMLFTSTYTLKSDFQTVAGLSPGADVRVGGIHAGT